MTPFMTVNLLLIYIITSAYLFLGSLYWESRLQAQFGEAYKAYQKKGAKDDPQPKQEEGLMLDKKEY
jgi:hypothetical protein